MGCESNAFLTLIPLMHILQMSSTSCQNEMDLLDSMLIVTLLRPTVCDNFIFLTQADGFYGNEEICVVTSTVT